MSDMNQDILLARLERRVAELFATLVPTVVDTIVDQILAAVNAPSIGQGHSQRANASGESLVSAQASVPAGSIAPTAQGSIVFVATDRAVSYAVSIKDLPAEVIHLIFRFLCRNLKPGTLLFREMRGVISLVCRYWSDIIHSTRWFWHTLVISPDSTATSIDQFLLYSGSSTFRLEITDTGRIDRSGRFANSHHVILPLLRYALHTSHRWEGLDINMCDFGPAHDVVDIVRGLPNLPITRFRLKCPSIYPSHSLPPTIYYSFRYPNLVSLEIVNARLPRALTFPLPRLERLVMVAMPDVAWPTTVEFFGLLSGSPALRSLELSGVGIRQPLTLDPTAPPPSRVVLHQLRSLTLTFGGDVPQVALSLHHYLPLISFPSLEHLNLTFHSESDFDTYVASDLLLNAPSVSIAGFIHSASLVQKLYSTLDRVVALDLTGCNPGGWSVGFKALGETVSMSDGTSVLVLPKLARLAVPGRRWKALYSGLLARSSRAPILESLELVAVTESPPGVVPVAQSGFYRDVLSISPNAFWSRPAYSYWDND